jgi:uncharacterized protein (TIGR02246 family)
MMPRPIHPRRPRAVRPLRALAPLALLAALAGCATTVRAPSRPEARAEVQAMLDNAAREWNRGDLDAFMLDYMPGDATTFIGSRGLLRGPEAIRAVYAGSYFRPGATRDSLSFELHDVDVISPDAVHVIAWYVLTRRTPAGADSVTSRGPTSLLMKRHEGRWRIVHDHSS